MKYTDPWERSDHSRRLHERVKKLDVGPAVEKLIDDTETTLAAITKSPEYQLAERTGNLFVYEDEIAAIRSRAERTMAKLAADAEGELAYLGPELAENRDAGSFANYVGADATERGWKRASLLLTSGIAMASVLELAKREGDREMLAGLEANASTWLRAAAGDRFDESSVRRSIDAVQAEIEAATAPMMDGSAAAYREAAREFEHRTVAARAWIDYGRRSATGRATPADRIELAYHVGDVPTGPEPKPSNGLRGDVTELLEQMPGAPGVGTTV